VEAEVQGASWIAQDVLQCGEVRVPGIMHLEVDLLDGGGDVWTGDCQVLKGPGEAPEVSQI
jgi:hypothetical protein